MGSCGASLLCLAGELYPEGKETDTRGTRTESWALHSGFFAWYACCLDVCPIRQDTSPALPAAVSPYPWEALKEYLSGAAT